MQQGPAKKRVDRDCAIDPTLWDRFAKAESREDYCQTWLELQCAIISDITQGLVILNDGTGGELSPVSKWPERGGNPERLLDISARVCQEGCGLLEELDVPGDAYFADTRLYAVAYPIIIDGRVHGAVAVEVPAESEQRLKAVMEHLQWGVSWLELLFRRRQAHADEAALARLQSAVDIMAGVLDEETCASACMAFVTEMATQLACDRVSIAFMRQNNARIQAISHSVQVRKRMNLVRAVEEAMDEAIVQRRDVVYPNPPDRDVIVLRSHKALSEQHGAGSVLTLPIYGEEKYYGALTFERSEDFPFSEEEVRFCRSVASLLFPVLEVKRKEDRMLLFKMGDAFKGQLTKLIGPAHTGRKVLVAAVLAVVVFFSVKTGEYKITADTVLEGAIQRVVVAPFDGYMKETHVKAGDIVQNQAVMCVLDDRELRLKRLNWLSKGAQLQRRYQEALAGYKRAEANIIKAQLDQASVQLDLAESQIARTRIVAPFEGIVVRDNLSQRLGGFVAKGEVLFEVTPLNAYRIILEVDERRIADVKVGQPGVMILAALPTEPIAFVVDKITPITSAKEGLNYFRVEAEMKTEPKHLRPGMEGVGKITVDRRNLFSIVTRGFREWLLLRTWSFWP